MDINDSLQKIIQSHIRTNFHFAELISHVSSPSHSATIKLAGSSTTISGIRYLKSYTPTNGDIVLCVVVRGDIIILGELQ